MTANPLAMMRTMTWVRFPSSPKYRDAPYSKWHVIDGGRLLCRARVPADRALQAWREGVYPPEPLCMTCMDRHTHRVNDAWADAQVSA